jgi:hypothetical protein
MLLGEKTMRTLNRDTIEVRLRAIAESVLDVLGDEYIYRMNPDFPNIIRFFYIAHSSNSEQDIEFMVSDYTKATWHEWTLFDGQSSYFTKCGFEDRTPRQLSDKLERLVDHIKAQMSQVNQMNQVHQVNPNQANPIKTATVAAPAVVSAR